MGHTNTFIVGVWDKADQFKIENLIGASMLRRCECLELRGCIAKFRIKMAEQPLRIHNRNVTGFIGQSQCILRANDPCHFREDGANFTRFNRQRGAGRSRKGEQRRSNLCK